ncbi:Flp family type IVb pilin [Shinella sp.]|uniref:Flp family type IVb pilin n=1 Tax=Shinella sp. TaxID=1870904 RepID=UPI00301C6468
MIAGLTKSFLSDEKGATAIEYGLLAALISVGLIAALTALGGNLENVLVTVSDNIKPK